MASNSALDLLIAEMLGDVGKLHDELRALKDAVPSLSAEIDQLLSKADQGMIEIVSKLQAESERLEYALTNLHGAVEKQINELAGAKLTQARINAETELKKSLPPLVAALVGAEFDKMLGAGGRLDAKVDECVGKLNLAAAKASEAAGKALDDAKKITAASKQGPMEKFAHHLVLVAVSALIAVVASSWLGPAKTAPQSQVTQNNSR